MTKLLERISSMLFSITEDPSSGSDLHRERRRPIEILEAISFDGENYQNVYHELLEFLEAKEGSATFSSRERELLHQIIDSVTCEEDMKTLHGVKTTSILKKKRSSKVSQKLKGAYPPVPFLILQPQPLQFNDAKEPPAAPNVNNQKVTCLEKKEYVVRDNGRRAKVFSARFEEDYDVNPTPPEPIQVEKLPFAPKPIEVPRIAPSFSQDSNSSLSFSEKKNLLQEAQKALEQERKASENFAPPPPSTSAITITTDGSKEKSTEEKNSSIISSQYTQLTQLTDKQSSFESGSFGSKPMTLEPIMSPGLSNAKEEQKPLFSFRPSQNVEEKKSNDDKKPAGFSFAPSEPPKKSSFNFHSQDEPPKKSPFTFPTGQTQPPSNAFVSSPKSEIASIAPDPVISKPDANLPSNTLSTIFDLTKGKNSEVLEKKPAFTFNASKDKGPESLKGIFSFDPKPEKSNEDERKEEKLKEESAPSNSFNFNFKPIGSSQSQGSPANTNTPFSFGVTKVEKPLQSAGFSSTPSFVQNADSAFKSSQPFSLPAILPDSSMAAGKAAYTADSSMISEKPEPSASQPVVSKPFVFGQNSQGSSQSSVFTFGSTQPPSQSFIFGSNAPPQQASQQPFTFNFGPKTEPQPKTMTQSSFNSGGITSQPTPTFTFGAGTTHPSPAFNSGSGGSFSQSTPAFNLSAALSSQPAQTPFSFNNNSNTAAPTSSPRSTVSSTSTTGRLVSRPHLRRNR